MSVTLRLRLEQLPKNSDRSFLDDDPQQFAVVPGHGFFSFEGLSPENLEHSSFGRAAFVALDKNIKKATADGQPLQIDANQPLWVNGDLSVQATSNGFGWKGPAEAIWVDGKRRNKTIWETLSEGWALSLIGAFIAALGWFLSRIYSFIREADAASSMPWLPER